MFGELLRRSSLSYIVSSAIFFTSEAFAISLSIIYDITGTAFYRNAQLYLPTSAVSSLPLLLESPFLPTRVVELLGLASFGGAVETSIPFSIALILIYFVTAFAIAFVYFERADISRKVS